MNPTCFARVAAVAVAFVVVAADAIPALGQAVGNPDDGTHALFWRATGPLPGAGPAITSLAETSADTERVYAASGAGVLLSRDRGNRWELRSRYPDVGAYSSGAIDASPVDADLLLLSVLGSGLWRSVDGGLSWTQPPGAPPDPWVFAPLFAPSCSFTAYLTGSDGVWRSLDAGLNWTEVLNGITARGGYAWETVVDFANPFHVYFHAWGLGLFESLDGGTTWSEKPYPNGVSYPLSIAIDPADGQRLLLGDQGVIYLTTDGGTTWVPSVSGLANDIIDAVAFDPEQTNRFYAGLRMHGLALSDDGGATWTTNADPGLDTAGGDPSALLPSRFHPRLLLVGDQGGIFRSHDRGVTFHPSNQGLGPFATVADVVVDPFERDRLVALTGGAAFVSEDSGAHWSLATGFRNFASFDLVADPVTRDRFYAGGFGGTFWRSDDGATTFFAAHPEDGSNWFAKVVAHPTVADRLFATGNCLKRSDDGGRTWAAVNLPLGWTWALGISPADPEVIYCVGSGDLYRSEDGGTTWLVADNSPAAIVRDIVCDPDHRDIAYAATPFGGFYRTLDRGRNWTLMAAELATASTALPIPGTTLVIANDDFGPRTLLSFDRGATAETLRGGVTTPVTSFALSRRSAIHAGTRGSGVMVLR